MNIVNEIIAKEVEQFPPTKTDMIIIEIREDIVTENREIKDALHICLQQIPEVMDNLDKNRPYIIV
ncbi:hypothetical protein [Oceanobacillus sp. FSL H7-0719]|uniref:hypothetical protein n=1 Tax=Oceanobacillus sp. FSL H7-0719 TaxID=2954507 RepID=UPI003255E362